MPDRREIGRILEIVIGVLFLCALEIPYAHEILLGHNDFSTFYAGAKLARTPALYDPAAARPLVEAGWPDAPPQEIYLRAPFYAVLLKPLAWLEYRAALIVFLALSLASFLWFVLRFAKESPELPILAAFSIPMFLNFNGGADVAFLLPLIGGFILFSRRGRDFAAGLLLALCAIKFHLFVFVPVLLIFMKKWRTLAGAVFGTAALMLLGGPSLILPWIQTMLSPLITGMPIWKLSPAPNIHGLAVVLGAGAKTEFVLTALVVAVFLFLCIRVREFELLLAAALVCGLLTSFHSFTYDDLLLMPALVLAAPYRVLKSIAGLALTPIAYLAAFAGGFYPAILPVMLVAFVAAACFTRPHSTLKISACDYSPRSTSRTAFETSLPNSSTVSAPPQS